MGIEGERIALVTGGAGFIGSHLVELHLARGDKVHVVDDLSTGSMDNIAHLFGHERFSFIKHNVSVAFHVMMQRTGATQLKHRARSGNTSSDCRR